MSLSTTSPALPGLSLSELERATVRAIADKPPFGYAGYRFLRRWTRTASGPAPATGSARRPSSPTRGPWSHSTVCSAPWPPTTVPTTSPAGAFVRGDIVDGDRLGAVLGTEALDALVRTGALHSTGAPGGIGLRAQVGVLAAGDLMVVIPPQVEEQGDLAYFGGDSIGLLERAWPLATGGRLAIELGTGTGFLAAALAPRYELVVATELLRSSASVAALTFRLNGSRPGSRRGRLAVCVTDVARVSAARLRRLRHRQPTLHAVRVR